MKTLLNNLGFLPKWNIESVRTQYSLGCRRRRG